MNEFVQEHVTGMHIVQAFWKRKGRKRKIRPNQRTCTEKANIDSILAFSIFFPVVEMLSATSVALLLWLGIGGVVEGDLTLGVVLQFILYVFMIYRPIRQLADRFNVLQMGVVNADRVFELLHTDERITDEGTVRLEKIDGLIEFENVWFSYEDEENWVLKDLSFSKLNLDQL